MLNGRGCMTISIQKLVGRKPNLSSPNLLSIGRSCNFPDHFSVEIWDALIRAYFLAYEYASEVDDLVQKTWEFLCTCKHFEEAIDLIPDAMRFAPLRDRAGKSLPAVRLDIEPYLRIRGLLAPAGAEAEQLAA